MKLNPYLQFNGDCETAFKFYEKCLGGKIVCMMKYEETPASEETPPDFRDKIIHVRMMLGEVALMGADSPPERYSKPSGIAVTLGIEEPAEAERVFKALSENGTITMPLEETFWAKRFGMLVDQFGTPWMINCEKLPA